MNTGIIKAKGDQSTDVYSGGLFGDYNIAAIVKNSVNLGKVISSNTAYGIAGKVNEVNNVVSLSTVNALIAYATWESFEGD